MSSCKRLNENAICYAFELTKIAVETAMTVAALRHRLKPTSRGQQLVDLFACAGDLFAVGVDVEVICHEEIAVPANGLDGLGIDPGLIEQAQVTVPEDVSRSAMQVEIPADIAKQPDVDHFGDGLFPAYDESLCFDGFEQLFELGIQRDRADAVLRLGGREDGLIRGVGYRPADGDCVLCEVD